MSIQAQRARYVPVEKGFNIKRPPIEPQAFAAEMIRAFADDAPTGFTPLDLAAALGTDYAATTPFMLARYVRIRKGERLDYAFAASGEMWAVLRGAGTLRRGDERIDWRETDMFALPGGVASSWQATRGLRPVGRDRRADACVRRRSARGRGARADRGDALPGGRHRP